MIDADSSRDSEVMNILEAAWKMEREKRQSLEKEVAGLYAVCTHLASKCKQSSKRIIDQLEFQIDKDKHHIVMLTA